MSQPPVDDVLWQRLCDAENAFVAARMEFIARSTQRVPTVRKGLKTHQRGTALRLLPFLPLAERLELFDDVLTLASVGHSDVDLCRGAIRELPRDWLLKHLEGRMHPILTTGGEEEHRRLLELSETIDLGIARRLALRASRHADPAIREAGEEFLERLGDAS